MSGMDLVEFLTARLDEDEGEARSATQGRWFWVEPDTGEFPTGSENLVADQGEWKTCEHFCTWSGAGNIHRGTPGKPGHEHRVIETVVGSWGYDAWGVDVEPGDAAHIARHGPARVLADVAAKRRLVEHLAGLAARCPEDDWPEDGDMSAAPLADHARYALRLLALPDADHADYNPSWANE